MAGVHPEVHDGIYMSPIVGWHHDRNPWIERGENGQELLGFRFRAGNWNNKPIIQELQPLYDRIDVGQANVIVAKVGYAVGGILVDSDEQEHAVRIVFMRSVDGRLNPKDTYLSDWINRPVTGSPPKLITGHGDRVVGVCGYRGMNLDGVGLVFQQR